MHLPGVPREPGDQLPWLPAYPSVPTTSADYKLQPPDVVYPGDRAPYDESDTLHPPQASGDETQVAPASGAAAVTGSQAAPQTPESPFPSDKPHKRSLSHGERQLNALRRESHNDAVPPQQPEEPKVQADESMDADRQTLLSEINDWIVGHRTTYRNIDTGKLAEKFAAAWTKHAHRSEDPQTVMADKYNWTRAMDTYARDVRYAQTAGITSSPEEVAFHNNREAIDAAISLKHTSRFVGDDTINRCAATSPADIIASVEGYIAKVAALERRYKDNPLVDQEVIREIAYSEKPNPAMRAWLAHRLDINTVLDDLLVKDKEVPPAVLARVAQAYTAEAVAPPPQESAPAVQPDAVEPSSPTMPGKEAFDRLRGLYQDGQMPKRGGVATTRGNNMPASLEKIHKELKSEVAAWRQWHPPEDKLADKIGKRFLTMFLRAIYTDNQRALPDIIDTPHVLDSYYTDAQKLADAGLPEPEALAQYNTPESILAAIDIARQSGLSDARIKFIAHHGVRIDLPKEIINIAANYRTALQTIADSPIGLMPETKILFTFAKEAHTPDEAAQRTQHLLSALEANRQLVAAAIQAGIAAAAISSALDIGGAAQLQHLLQQHRHG